MLHLITCHGRIMPRLAELLLVFETLKQTFFSQTGLSFKGCPTHPKDKGGKYFHVIIVSFGSVLISVNGNGCTFRGSNSVKIVSTSGKGCTL